MTKKTFWASMVLLAIGSSNAAAQWCVDTVEGTSAAEGMALCMRYSTGTNRVYVAVCTEGATSWVDVCDSSGTLTDDVTIRGLGGADGLSTVDATGSLSIDGGCTITCYGEVDLDVYTVTLEGGLGADVLYSSNATGQLVLDGGAENDVIRLDDGSYAGNILDGDEGDDVVVDGGGGWDYLYGGTGDDCLSALCFAEMDCGEDPGDYDIRYWLGSWYCCAGLEFCPTPQNCEGTAPVGCTN